MIDEAGLHGLPLGDEALLLWGAEVADSQGFDAGFAIGQFGFGLARGTVRDNRAVVLRAEAVAQGNGSGFAALKVGGHGDDDHQGDDKRGYEELGVGEVKRHCALLYGGYPPWQQVDGEGPIRNP